jgi:uncharacterized HAD superfamily protein
MMMNEMKIILTDVDGVLLNWNHSFEYWLTRNGYERVSTEHYELDKCFTKNGEHVSPEKMKSLIYRFNETASIGWLPPLNDALKYVRKLHEEHGYVLHCITSISDDPYVYKLRKLNLERIFGKRTVERLECVSSSKYKVPILQEYADSGLLWVEDKVSNVNRGQELGLQGVLVNHEYNSKENPISGVIRVNTWSEIYNLVAENI